MEPMDDLSDADLERYARHVILDEIGEEGQIALLQSKVCIVGAGGLGSLGKRYRHLKTSAPRFFLPLS